MTTHFQQLEASLNALRAHYRARMGETSALRTLLATADAEAATCASTCRRLREDLRAGIAISADAVITAFRASSEAHAQADEIRDSLEHAESLEHEALDNMKRAADNLIAEIEAMVLMEAQKPELDDIGPVWDSLKG